MHKINIIRVKSPANIAFIKYWGQKDASLVIPLHDSFSMNLSNCITTTEIHVFDDPSIQQVRIQAYGKKSYSDAPDAVVKHIVHFYKTVKEYIESTDEFGFEILIQNSFPHKAGIASSASLFSSLAVGFTTMFSKKLPEKDLSILARMSGSGSAARSIPDGFVWWHKGSIDTDEGISMSSYAESIKGSGYWDLHDVVVISSTDEKKVSSQEGHKETETSPFAADRLLGVSNRLIEIEKAFLNKDLKKFGRIIEEEALSMHMVMMSQKNPLIFWSGATLDVIREIMKMRLDGIDVYYTIDAGENVHAICLGADVDAVTKRLSNIDGVKDCIDNSPAIGTRLLET